MELPKAEDKLFANETSRTTGAWLRSPADKFLIYSEGYKMAGDKIFENCSPSSFNNNVLVYPMVFNYRQFVELKLKELIMLGNQLIGINEGFPREHNLSKLWDAFRNEIFPRIRPEGENKNTFDNAQKVISQFTTEDPESMNFRYPIKKDNSESMSRDTVDLDNLKGVMDRLYNFLNCIWDEILHYLDMQDAQKQEYLHDMRS